MELVYPFSAANGLAAADHRDVLGGKGASLAAMTAAGLPVPPGFTIAAEACRSYLSDGWSSELTSALAAGVDGLERLSGKRLGDVDRPLLVSVRSGAATSMPGMMDTVLNVGMNSEVETALGALSDDAGFASDTHRRFLLSFASIVLGAEAATIDRLGALGADLDAAEVASSLAAGGYHIPVGPAEQLEAAVRAVFDSWTSPRAVHYRNVEGIDSSIGTAVTVQMMVFGNLGSNSGTGVAFSRNPTTGVPGVMGDFLDQAQGEDVVSGTRVTRSLADMAADWPEVFNQLNETARRLELHYRDMVDIEFTVEQGSLWFLQARSAKRSPIAAFRAAIDMAEDPAFPLDRAEAVARCRRYFDDPPTVTNGGEGAESVESAGETGDELLVIATGLGVCPGWASGQLCLDPDEAVELRDRGVELILARTETSPADVHGMAAASGLFTTLGGEVSHAALVAREWGLPAVVGASQAKIVDGAIIGPGGRIEAGAVVTVDGDSGRLLRGRHSEAQVIAPEVLTVLGWAADLDAEGAASPTSTSLPSPSPSPSLSPNPNPIAVVDGEETGTAISSPEKVDGVDFRVFHALRIKAMATIDVLAGLVGGDPEPIEQALQQLVTDGHATFMEPRSLWVLSPEGRTAHQSALAEAVGPLDLTTLPYAEFMALNTEFKQLCTDWQIRSGEPNDHTDETYDARIRSRLAAHDDQAQPAIAAIGEIVPWMAAYGPRLRAARERVAAGDPKALTGVMCESYHDVWMELHEDLILTQGIDRAAEGSF